MTKVFFNRSIAVLELPENITDLVACAKSIHIAMNESPYFDHLESQIFQLLTDTIMLERSLGNFVKKPKKFIENESDISLSLVQSGLLYLLKEVQALADEQEELSKEIVLSAGMKVIIKRQRRLAKTCKEKVN